MPAAPKLFLPVWAQDAALAAIIALLGLASGLGRHGQQWIAPAATALLTAMGVILLLRRRLPGTVAAFEAVMVVAVTLMHTSLKATVLAVLVSGYSAAVYGTPAAGQGPAGRGHRRRRGSGHPSGIRRG